MATLDTGTSVWANDKTHGWMRGAIINNSESYTVKLKDVTRKHNITKIPTI